MIIDHHIGAKSAFAGKRCLPNACGYCCANVVTAGGMRVEGTEVNDNVKDVKAGRYGVDQACAFSRGNPAVRLGRNELKSIIASYRNIRIEEGREGGQTVITNSCKRWR